MTESLTVESTAPPFRTTDAERREIVAKRLAGVTVKDIAKQHDISEVTVWRICKPLKDTADAVAAGWRQEQTQLAVKSVNRALSDRSDVYKSATIGVQALKGLGVYAPDQQQMNVVQLVNQVPGDWADRYSEVEHTPTPSGTLLNNGAASDNSSGISDANTT